MPASRKSSIAQIALQAPEIWNRFSAAEVVGEIFLGVSNENNLYAATALAALATALPARRRHRSC
jgi:hypothetical protein